MYCNNCGHKNSNKALYCSKCNSILGSSNTSKEKSFFDNPNSKEPHTSYSPSTDDNNSPASNDLKLDDCTRENYVAKKLRAVSNIFARAATFVYKWLVGLAIAEGIIAIIISIVEAVELDEFVYFVYGLVGAVIWFFINVLNAKFIRFILNCISLNYLCKSEQVQKASNTASLAYYIAKNTIKD